MKRLLKQNHVGDKPVKQWYQSFGSHPWDTPTTGFQTGRFLLRETPKRLNQWSNRRSTISPKGKQMLAQKVMENERFNDAQKKKKEKGKAPTITRKEKRARC